MARATGANAKLYAAAESVYGTKPSGGFRKFPFHSVDVRAQQDLQESTLLGQGRDAQDPSLGAVSVSGRLVVPVDLRNIGFWLKMLLGAPASVDNMGVVTHTYLSGAQSLPSFSLETVMPEVPEYVVSLGALVNSLQLDFQRTGEAQAQLEVMGQGETSNSTSQHGTPDADHALTRFSTFQGQIDIDGSQAANVLSGSVSFSNGLDPVETIRADGLIDGIDPGQATTEPGVSVDPFTSRGSVHRLAHSRSDQQLAGAVDGEHLDREARCRP